MNVDRAGTRVRSALYAILCVSALVLAGCTHSTRTAYPRHYDLGPLPSIPSHPVAGNGKVLRIARIDVPPWLAGTAMYYRLDYRNDQSLATYARSDWIAPPARLVGSLLARTVARDGRWRAIVSPGNPANADATLHVALDDFSQAFAQPGRSRAILDATATLVGDHDDHIVAQRHFHVEVDAASPDASGGAAALAGASRQFASQLQRWLDTAAHEGGKQPG